MRGWGIFSVFLFLSLSAQAESPCDLFFKSLAAHSELQPVKVLFRGKNFLFHNRRLAKIFKDGPTAAAIDAAEKLQTEKSGLQIRLDAEGRIVAADSRGSYAQAIWARDSARAARALPPAERKRAFTALLRMMTSPLNMELFYLNIRETSLHRMSGDELRAYIHFKWNPLYEGLPMMNSMFVPHIRFLLSQFESAAAKPELWNMKQNDGLALVFIEALSALRDGQLEWKDLDDNQSAYFGLVLSYFIRTQFWEKFDAGAWEEANGRRTSSIALATDALLIFKESGLGPQILEKIRVNPNIPGDIKNFVSESLNPLNIQEAIKNGKQIVLDQLQRGEAPDRFEHGAKQAHRTSDAALAHLLWYMPTFLREADYRLIFSHLDKLRRASGVIRYEGDVYLHIGQFLPADDFLPLELHRDRERRVSVSEVGAAFWYKEPEILQKIFGPHYEAQWTLSDRIEIQGLVRMIQLFPDSPHIEEYRNRLDEATMRMFGSTTGEGTDGQGPFAMDGLRVDSWRETEAWIPVRRYLEDGTVDTLWMASKFTPLNWAVAEKILAIEALKSLRR